MIVTYVCEGVPGVLDAAAHYVESQGSTQRTYEDGAGRVCIVGAIANVGDLHPFGPHPSEPAAPLQRSCDRRSVPTAFPYRGRG